MEEALHVGVVLTVFAATVRLRAIVQPMMRREKRSMTVAR
jgi:hypothetical protein